MDGSIHREEHQLHVEDSSLTRKQHSPSSIDGIFLMAELWDPDLSRMK